MRDIPPDQKVGFIEIKSFVQSFNLEDISVDEEVFSRQVYRLLQERGGSSERDILEAVISTFDYYSLKKESVGRSIHRDESRHSYFDLENQNIFDFLKTESGIEFINIQIGRQKEILTKLSLGKTELEAKDRHYFRQFIETKLIGYIDYCNWASIQYSHLEHVNPKTLPLFWREVQRKSDGRVKYEILNPAHPILISFIENLEVFAQKTGQIEKERFYVHRLSNLGYEVERIAKILKMNIGDVRSLQRKELISDELHISMVLDFLKSTPSDREVMELYSRGYSIYKIAHNLGVTLPFVYRAISREDYGVSTQRVAFEKLELDFRQIEDKLITYNGVHKIGLERLLYKGEYGLINLYFLLQSNPFPSEIAIQLGYSEEYLKQQITRLKQSVLEGDDPKLKSRDLHHWVEMESVEVALRYLSTDIKTRTIIELLVKNPSMTQRELASELDVSKGTIQNILKNIVGVFGDDWLSNESIAQMLEI